MRILCLGDSVTDCGRLWYEPPLGNGYVKIMDRLAAHAADHPGLRFSSSSGAEGKGFPVKNAGKPEFVNRGIDGLTVERLLRNVEAANIPADIITVLIGINDIGLMMNTNRTPEQQKDMMQTFFRNYERLLDTLRSSLSIASDTNPHTNEFSVPAHKKRAPQIILMEPFIFPYPDHYKLWIPLVQTMSQGIHALSDQYHLPYLLLQEDLTAAGERNGWDFITTDGIHLTAQGHRILAGKLWDQIVLTAPVD